MIKSVLKMPSTFYLIFQFLQYLNTSNHVTCHVILTDRELLFLFRPSVDLYFYVIGAAGENELMLQSVLQCLFDSLSILLRKDVEKKTIFQNLGTVMLATDEICDKGVIMEHDPYKVASRVTVRSEDLPIGEQTVSQVLNNYKEQLKMSLLR